MKPGAHTLVDVDQRVDEHEDLQPVHAADGDRGEARPLVVGAAEERERQHDEAEHEADVARLEGGAEQQAERGHGDARQRDQREHDGPVHGQVGVHAGRVHDGGDREHDDGREQPLGRSGENLGGGDQPDRAGRLHAVLDLARVAELGRQLQGDRLDALEHDRDRRRRRGRARSRSRLGAGPAPPPMPWPICGNTYRNTNTSRNGWIRVRSDELAEVLAQHDQVAQDQRAERGAARRGVERVGVAARSCRAPARGGSAVGGRVIRAAPCRSG